MSEERNRPDANQMVDLDNPRSAKESDAKAARGIHTMVSISLKLLCKLLDFRRFTPRRSVGLLNAIGYSLLEYDVKFSSFA